MAIGDVIVSVIDVGQGQCTFVEVYDDDGMDPVLLHTLLFDCGSDHKSLSTGLNLDYIVKKIVGMGSPGFDCVFFSHSDYDHISLMWDILAKIKVAIKSPKTFSISRVIYGGPWDNYTKHKKNILQFIFDEKLCDDIRGEESNYSDYTKTALTDDQSLWYSPDGEVVVYALIVNVLSRKPNFAKNDPVPATTSSVALNRFSLIACLQYKSATVVICGDATNATMAASNILLKDTSFFTNNLMTTLPHHGSRATGLAVSSAGKASKNSLETVSTFASNLRSLTITVSAYAHEGGHPSLDLLNMFIPTLTTAIIKDPRLVQDNSHLITASIDIDLTKPDGTVIAKENDKTFGTLTNTFTTFYINGAEAFAYNLNTLLRATTAAQGVKPDKGAINPHACWVYFIKPDGSCFLEGYSNMSQDTSFTKGVGSALEKSLSRSLAVIPAFQVRTKAHQKTVAPALPNTAIIHPYLKHFA